MADRMALSHDPRHRLDVEAWERNYLVMDRSIASRTRRLRFFSFPADALILDLGCGDGLEVASLKAAGARRLVALDISLNLARRVTGIPIVVAHAARLPFRDGCFDLVYANNVLHHLILNDFRRALTRILKPGGSLCFVEPNPSWFRTLADLFCFSPLAWFFPALRARGSDIRQELPEYHRWLAGIDHWLADLRANGFTPLVVKRGLFRIYAQWQKAAAGRPGLALPDAGAAAHG